MTSLAVRCEREGATPVAADARRDGRASAVTPEAEDASLPPLSGFSVGVTAVRRADDLTALFRQAGARVLSAPALQFVPFAEISELLAATRRVVREEVDVVIATTATGFDAWIEAAAGWGLEEDLLVRLRRARILARGGKTREAVRSAGLGDSCTASPERCAGVLDHLLESGVDGKRIAVQLYGAPMPHLVGPLRDAGAEVVEIPVYRWEEPDDPDPLRRLLDAVLEGSVDALPLTSPVAVRHLLAEAERRGQLADVAEVLRARVAVSATGPVTADPLLSLGIPVGQPQRAGVGALFRVTAQELRRRTLRLDVNGTRLQLRGQAVLVDGAMRETTPAQMAVLRALAVRPGSVLSRSALADVLPGGGREHAVESVVSRLRGSLSTPGLVQTVTKRGYRLNVGTGEQLTSGSAATPRGR